MTRARGFTLIEAVVVIVITGILAGVVAVFIAKPVQGYVESTRRAVLSDIADGALRFIGRDVRMAVPNSVRVDASSHYVEFIPTEDGVRYRVEAGGGSSNILDFSLSTTEAGFDVFGVSPVSASVGDYLTVFNTGQCSNTTCTAACGNLGANAYEGCNRRTLTSVISTLSGGVTYGTGISFTATSNPLPFDSPGHRVNFVPSTGPVSYGCTGTLGALDASGNGQGQLKRYTGYATGAGTWNALTQPTAFATGTNAVLADNISACTITYAQGVSQRDAVLSLSLTITRGSESVTLYHEIHVDNQP
ncbi:MAG: type II secretion system protein [Rhodocyclaceae bacterium]|nr:MAG: type II secretion system protein [Rhodocyclaceae bacterium]